jgi:hypothetical protein
MPRPIISQAVKRSKYGVRQDAVGKLRRTLDGVTYDSAKERDYAATLFLLVKCGKARGIQRQAPIPLQVGNKTIGYHYVDFLLTKLDGTQEVHEVKGYETELWKWKKAHFEAQYPHIRYTVVPARRVK